MKQEGNLALYMKPSELLSANNVMDIRELTTYFTKEA